MGMTSTEVCKLYYISWFHGYNKISANTTQNTDYPEDGGSMLLRYVGNYEASYIVSYCARLESSCVNI
jgi:hypothetical protein